MRHLLSALVQINLVFWPTFRGCWLRAASILTAWQSARRKIPAFAHDLRGHGDDLVLEQVRKATRQKSFRSLRVDDISSADYVERDLMLIKVKAPSEKRLEISLLVEMFRARWWMSARTT